jgi:hypothetical protein
MIMKDPQPLRVLRTNRGNLIFAILCFTISYFTFFQLDRPILAFIALIAAIQVLWSSFNKVEIYEDCMVLLTPLGLYDRKNILFDSITKYESTPFFTNLYISSSRWPIQIRATQDDQYILRTLMEKVDLEKNNQKFEKQFKF